MFVLVTLTRFITLPTMLLRIVENLIILFVADEADVIDNRTANAKVKLTLCSYTTKTR